jgi:hypothetical protein
VGSQSPITDVGFPVEGVFTWMVVWYAPLASKNANIGAMWFMVVWQLAQMIEVVS